MVDVFKVSVVSETVLKVAEEDEFGEKPFIYLILGEDQLVVVDTGCGTANLDEYIRSTLTQQFPRLKLLVDNILVINTHNHFDHVGSNHRFSPAQGKLKFCADLCCGDANKEYSVGKFNTMGWVVSCVLQPYTVTRWLSDGEVIPLSTQDETDILKVIHVPGHTPDSLCLYYPKDRRVFVGDLLYRHANVLCGSVKSCFKSYDNSTKKLLSFLKEEEQRNLDIQSGTDFVTDQKTGGIFNEHSFHLSCGHVDDNLEWTWLEKFSSFLQRIGAGEERCTRVTQGPGFLKTYSGEDGSLKFVHRSFMAADALLTVPLLKLFFRKKY